MRIARKLPGILEIRGDTGLGSPVLIGVAFLLVPIAFWAASEEPLSSSRIQAAVALLLIGALVLRLGVTRARKVVLGEAPARIIASGVETRLQSGARLRLTGVRRPHSSRKDGYGVELLNPGGDRWTILSGTDPAKVLSDCLAVSRALGLPIEAGWGLESRAASFPMLESSERNASARPSVLDEADADRRRVGFASLAGALGAAGIFGLEIRARIVLGEQPSWLSLILPILVVLMLIGFGLVLTTGRDRIRMSGGKVRLERRVAGQLVWRKTIAPGGVLGAHWVGPLGARRDLLLETTNGPLAVSGGDEVDTELAALIASGRAIGGDSPRDMRG